MSKLGSSPTSRLRETVALVLGEEQQTPVKHSHSSRVRTLAKLTRELAVLLELYDESSWYRNKEAEFVDAVRAAITKAGR